MSFVNKNKSTFLMLSIVFFIMIFSFLNPGVLEHGDDEVFHMLRIKDLAENIKIGNIPYYISYFRHRGYGSADMTFYPYGTMYLPAIIYLLTKNLIFSFKVWAIAGTCITVIFMYIASKEIFKNEKIAIISTIVFALARTNIANLHAVYDIPQTIAIASSCLLIAGFYNLFFSDRKKWYYIVVSFTLMLQSHILTTFYFALMAAFFCIICIKKVLSEKEIRNKLIFCIVLLISLNIGFVYPFIKAYLVDGDFISVYTNIRLPIKYKPLITDIFGSVPFLPYHYNLRYFLYGIYFVTTYSFIQFALFIVAIFIVITKKETESKSNKKIAIAFLLIFIYFIFAYMGIWNITPFTSKLFRLQELSHREIIRALPFFSMFIGYAFSKIFSKRSSYYILIAILFFDIFSDNMRNLYHFTDDYQLDMFNDLGLNSYIMTYKGKLKLVDNTNTLKDDDKILEFYYDWTSLNLDHTEYYTEKLIADNVSVSNEKKGDFKYSLDYEKIDESYESKLIFPFCNAYGFKAFLNGNKELSLKKFPHGLIEINTSYFPTTGHLDIYYEKPLDYVVAFYISLLAYLALFVYLLKKKK